MYYPTLHRIRRLRESDSVQTQAVLTSFKEHEIEYVYIELLKAIYTSRSMTVHLQRKQQDQHQERYTTGRYHIFPAVHGSTRKHIPTTDLGNQRLDVRWRISLSPSFC